MLIPQISVYDIDIKSAQEGYYFLVRTLNQLIEEHNKHILDSIEVQFNCTNGDLHIAPRKNPSDIDGNVDLEKIWGCEY